MIWVVHSAHLDRALLDRALQLGTAVHVNSRAIHIDFETSTVTTVRGFGMRGFGMNILQCDVVKYSADLILGCDGIRSVRRGFF
jgi:2-polyprenyl-6-methoxyphenol hydroxylase-like FAD-dependent oxidoreductase